MSAINQDRMKVEVVFYITKDGYDRLIRICDMYGDIDIEEALAEGIMGIIKTLEDYITKQKKKGLKWHKTQHEWVLDRKQDE